ncbi:hypothetical protein SACS_1405 [Parasaccharibacter apium]|uniref:Uncharacterized protein n=1 Tax=Parasaccharibacter apium TaxID=1510841 RepID=A0A7U7G6R6_9PROT|nr:hypothetical protein SACS_1405 [Parasaccharibacter apium]
MRQAGAWRALHHGLSILISAGTGDALCRVVRHHSRLAP